MIAHPTETDFLLQCILYADTGERQKLEERILQVRRNERCVRRAVWFMALLIALALAGLSYCAVFYAGHPHVMSIYRTQFVSRAFCTLGLGSLISLLTFAGLWVAYRKQFDQLRQECHRLAAQVLETHLGKPRTMPLPVIINAAAIPEGGAPPATREPTQRHPPVCFSERR